MSLYVWGCNTSNQLGLSTKKPLKQIAQPTFVDAFKYEKIVDFSAGEQHSLAVNEYGDVFAWGRGKEGQLGFKSLQEPLPQRIEALEGQVITNVSCGDMHSLALSSDGWVFMWGLLHEARIVKHQDTEETTVTTTGDAFNNPTVALAGLTPSDPRLPQDDHRRMMERLVAHSESLYQSVNPDNQSESSSLLPTMSEFLQSPLPDQTVVTVRAPCAVPRLCEALIKYKINKIAAGFAHSLVTCDDGQVFSCGYNDSGQLGLGTRQHSVEFRPITALRGHYMKEIACGQQHSLACSQEGHCFAWGLGILGQLGNGQTKIAWTPIRIEFTCPIVSIAAGSHHSVAVNTKGQVYTWGHSEYGQHGAGGHSEDLQESSHYFYPRLQHFIEAKGLKIVQVACASHSTFVRTTSGQVYSWGWNVFGVLGNNSPYQLSVHPEPLDVHYQDTTTMMIQSLAVGYNHGSILVRQPSGCHYSLQYDQLLCFDKEKMFADVLLNLQVQGQGGGGGHVTSVKRYVHRVVLTARSPYMKGFLRVAQEKASESNSSRLLVINNFGSDGNVDIQVVDTWLYFLYTDRLLELPFHKRKKFQQFLKQVCQFELVDVKQENKLSTFVQDMRQLLLNDSHKNGDVVFTYSDNRRIYAHKCILSQVDYFKKMFTSGFKESSLTRTQSGHFFEISLDKMIQQEEIQWKTFQQVVEWIYTGSLNLLLIQEQQQQQEEESIDYMDLFVCASLIGVDGLMQFCEQKLMDILKETVKCQDDQEMKHTAANNCLQFAQQFDAKKLSMLSQNFLIN